MFELLEAMLCHNVTTKTEPVILRPQFYATDPFVVIFLSIRVITQHDEKLTFRWDHASGFSTSSTKDLFDEPGYIHTYAYMSPLLVQASASVDPTGLWRTRVFAGGQCFIAQKFEVLQSPELKQPHFFDVSI